MISMQRRSRRKPCPLPRSGSVTSTMLIHDVWGPSGRASAVATHLPAASLMPSADPEAIIKRQSAAIWFQPASTESGHTLSASSG